MVIGKTYELGTPNTYTQEAIIEHLNEILNFHKRIVPVPKEIAKYAERHQATERAIHSFIHPCLLAHLSLDLGSPPKALRSNAGRDGTRPTR